ncbi:hypothetical protein M422DRAFT_156207 [Sphaerobolus stellatus SS14]|nr:hypothetical protein M422DRAFT_156207 [Sphaerobolus stellatus SS14]
MGSGLALLFAEHGGLVSIFDAKEEMVQAALKAAEHDTTVPESSLQPTKSLKEFASSFRPDQPRVIVLSLPHGSTIDKVLEELGPLLNQGDVVLDGANEWWEETERRQKWMKEKFGVHFLGCGVSGGYQSARRGPSMSPGGEKDAYALVEPLLKKWAAKTPSGEACVKYIGPGGAGHFVKMIHNGIEQGMLSVVCEAYAFLHQCLALSNDDIANIFESWNNNGELKGNYLVKIGAEALRFKKGDGAENSAGIVNDIDDKVTQDVDNSEGTGVWSMKAWAGRHVAAPTLAAAHNLRILSSQKDERSAIAQLMGVVQPHHPTAPGADKMAAVESLRVAVYGSFLASFVQGCNVIARVSKDQGWGISLADCIQIWRAGCIIQSDYIADLLQPHYDKDSSIVNTLLIPEIAKAVAGTYPALKEIVSSAVQLDAIVPAISASLEYIKSVASNDLPTNFEETELDCFGHHNYDLKRENKGAARKGAHHTEWKSA